jgi:hypothetical protein
MTLICPALALSIALHHCRPINRHTGALLAQWSAHHLVGAPPLISDCTPYLARSRRKSFTDPQKIYYFVSMRSSMRLLEQDPTSPYLMPRSPVGSTRRAVLQRPCSEASTSNFCAAFFVMRVLLATARKTSQKRILRAICTECISRLRA